MSTDTEPTTWAIGDWATIPTPDGDRDRGQVVDLRHEAGRWVVDVVPARDDAERVTVLANELWPDA